MDKRKAILKIGPYFCIDRLQTFFLLLSLLLIFPHEELLAKQVIYDYANQPFKTLFLYENTKYIIKHNHQFSQTLKIPKNCELHFEGGSLTGGLEFENTLLTGNIKLQGSKLSGHVKNDYMRSEWLCYRDGIHDDANNINQMIAVCGKVCFQKGNYLLKSVHRGPKVENVLDEWQAEAHIGIPISNVELIGEEKDVIFTTYNPCGIICIYSPPYMFDKMVQNIKIENITFRSVNNGKDFWQLKHTIKVIGVNGLIIKKCNFDDFWGDAICLHSYGDTPSTGERTRNSNVLIYNNHIKGGKHHNNRNGVSVVNGVNVRIENNFIEQTSRKDMPGAIDVEANSNAFSIKNIVIKNNIIKNCKGTAGGICINSKGYDAPAYAIIIEGNHISGCTSGLAFVVKTDNRTSNYKIYKNVVEGDTTPYQFVGNGSTSNWIFKSNVFKKHTTLKIPGNIHVDGLVTKGNLFYSE